MRTLDTRHKELPISVHGTRVTDFIPRSVRNSFRVSSFPARVLLLSVFLFSRFLFLFKFLAFFLVSRFLILPCYSSLAVINPRRYRPRRFLEIPLEKSIRQEFCFPPPLLSLSSFSFEQSRRLISTSFNRPRNRFLSRIYSRFTANAFSKHDFNAITWDKQSAS